MGKKYWADGTPVAGQQLEYGFDDIGNRLSTKTGGDENGMNLQSTSYSPNLLNQYTQRTVPGAVPVLGLAEAASTVTVNSGSTYRHGEYFWKELSAANTTVPVWQSVSVQAVHGANNNTVSGNVFVPQTPEAYSYDFDGNLTGDGRWSYTWDAENRLVRLVAATAVGPQQRIDFEYDAGSRRIRKKVWNNTSGTGTPATDIKFLYQGWNLIAELNALSSDAVIRSFVWGNDLSGTFQGAGGVGGLLAVKSSGVCHFTAYDGNGNVIALINGSTGTASAQYEYGPFGEMIRATGSLGNANPIRFSTKYQDEEGGLLYYGYRYYNSSIERWLSHDPLGESEFFKRYAKGKTFEEILELAKKGLQAGYQFAGNNPITQIDILGLENVQIVVTLVIRPPDMQAGVKTIHSVVVNEYGKIVSRSTFTGTTSIGGIAYPTGTSVFRDWVTGSHPNFTVTMIGNSSSAALPSFFDIDYNYDIHLNFCSRTGTLSGINDGYPSYTVRVKGKTVWDWQQQTLLSLLGDGEITASAPEFNW